MTHSEHIRWCITALPCTPAEYTVFRFMFGFDPRFNYAKFIRHIRSK